MSPRLSMGGRPGSPIFFAAGLASHHQHGCWKARNSEAPPVKTDMLCLSAWLWFWWPWGVASTTMWPNPCLQQWRQWKTKVEVCIFVKAWQLLFKLFVFVNVVRQIVRPCLWKQNLRITQRQVDWHGKLRSRDVDFYCQRCGLPKKKVHQPFWGSITPSPQTSKWRHEWGDIIFSLFL